MAEEAIPARRPWSWKRFGGKFLVISIAVHVLLGLGATVWVVQNIQAKRKLTFKGGPPNPNPATRSLEHKVQMAKKQSTMSAPAMAKRITTVGPSKVSLPEMPAMPKVSEAAPAKMAGMGGTGVGLSAGGLGSLGGGGIGGSGGFSLPKAVADRCSAMSRSAAMKANGGNERCETAIGKSLNYLKSHQNPDGSWGEAYKCAMSGLSVLAYMGHCERPGSGEFGESVSKGIDYLVQLGTARKGKTFTSSVYEHAIAVYALGEAYILTKDQKLAPILTDGIETIIKGQADDGGWMYGFNKVMPSDTSVSGWQIQALKAAHLSGLNIPGVDECMTKAMENIKRVQNPNGAFGYRTTGGVKDAHWGLVGVGILCLQIGSSEKGPPVQKAFRYMFSKEQGVPQKLEYKEKTANLYAWYYNTQAAFQAGGSWWGRWNSRFQPELLQNQDNDGSWPPVAESEAAGADSKLNYNGSSNTPESRIYRTALCTLMLEVYYRYLATAR